MGKKDKSAGHELSGKTSDRIRSGEIAAGKVERADERPTPKAVKAAKGVALGKGATDRGGNAGAS